MRGSSWSAGALWLGRALTWTPNPLRRRLDRLTAVLALGVLVAALAVPVGVVAWGEARYAADARAAIVAAETRHPVDAVVIAKPTVEVVGVHPDYQTTIRRADVRWSGVGGASRVENVEVGQAIDRGSKIVVWVDGADRIVAKPLTERQLRAAEVAFTFGLIALGEAMCAALMACLLAAAGARAQRAWGREWETVGPKWMRQEY